MFKIYVLRLWEALGWTSIFWVAGAIVALYLFVVLARARREAQANLCEGLCWVIMAMLFAFICRDNLIPHADWAYWLVPVECALSAGFGLIFSWLTNCEPPVAAWGKFVSPFVAFFVSVCLAHSHSIPTSDFLTSAGKMLAIAATIAIASVFMGAWLWARVTRCGTAAGLYTGGGTMPFTLLPRSKVSRHPPFWLCLILRFHIVFTLLVVAIQILEALHHLNFTT